MGVLVLLFALPGGLSFDASKETKMLCGENSFLAPARKGNLPTPLRTLT